MENFLLLIKKKESLVNKFSILYVLANLIFWATFEKLPFRIFIYIW